MIVVVSGASGSGNAKVGLRLAERLGCPFVDGEQHQPEGNVEKRRAGESLSDLDLWPWLDAVSRVMEQHRRAGHDCVVACNALRRSDRDRLQHNLRGESVRFVQLEARSADFANPPPHPDDPAIVVDAALSPEQIIESIARDLPDLPELLLPEKTH